LAEVDCDGKANMPKHPVVDQTTFADARFAASFAEEWIEAWNAHDLDRILAHYDADVSFRSPYVAAFGVPSGTLHGKGALGDYFARTLARVPDLRFELERVFVGVASVAVSYRSVAGVPAVEVMGCGSGTLASEVSCHYAASTTERMGNHRG
jgi:ketosteroid isomerase-like protein